MPGPGCAAVLDDWRLGAVQPVRVVPGGVVGPVAERDQDREDTVGALAARLGCAAVAGPAVVTRLDGTAVATSISRTVRDT
ncbi:hypothetical protein [Streptomyces sp. TRM49041]|uniref:hypothetical protein n=1 Tax=Streptomyces sp. TRM49041 TaxID=2603216 RepID=UPI0011EF45D7|nr:hypothetical protein [Streptomyces sp. TRM49041]